jgi:hypothetical protein
VDVTKVERLKTVLQRDWKKCNNISVFFPMLQVSFEVDIAPRSNMVALLLVVCLRLRHLSRNKIVFLRNQIFDGQHSGILAKPKERKRGVVRIFQLSTPTGKRGVAEVTSGRAGGGINVEVERKESSWTKASLAVRGLFTTRGKDLRGMIRGEAGLKSSLNSPPSSFSQLRKIPKLSSLCPAPFLSSSPGVMKSFMLFPTAAATARVRK